MQTKPISLPPCLPLSLPDFAAIQTQRGRATTVHHAMVMLFQIWRRGEHTWIRGAGLVTIDSWRAMASRMPAPRTRTTRRVTVLGLVTMLLTMGLVGATAS